MEINKEKFILDACCSGRMMWFEKSHPNAVYIDIRAKGEGKFEQRPNFEVNPDIQMDFRALTFPDKSFKLIVWDPPHGTSFSETSIMAKKFGCLNAETWQYDLKKGFSELWRVLDDYGVLVFKWNDVSIPYKKVLAQFSENPLFQRLWKLKEHDRIGLRL